MPNSSMISARIHAGLTYYLRRIGRCTAPLSPLIETIVCRSAVDPWSEVQRPFLPLPLPSSVPHLSLLHLTTGFQPHVRVAACVQVHATGSVLLPPPLRSRSRSMILMKRARLCSRDREKAADHGGYERAIHPSCATKRRRGEISDDGGEGGKIVPRASLLWRPARVLWLNYVTL